MEIRNRVIEILEVKLGDISDHPQNPKSHSDYQKEVMSGVLEDIGWAGIPLVYRNGSNGDLVFLDGHMRGDIAPDMTVKVAVTDLNAEEAAYFLTTYDPLARLAETESENLDSLLGMISSDNPAVQSMLGEIAAEAGLFYGNEEEPIEDPGAEIDIAEELREKWEVESGQLWQLGEHRVICGDCTDMAVVERLMGRKKADMVFTDPPYNIDYGNIKHRKFKERPIENDSMNQEEWLNFCETVAGIIKITTDGCIYVCHAPAQDGRVMAGVLDKHFHCSTTIIWVKDVFTLGRGKYQNRYEPIWFGWAEEGKSFINDRTLDNVWEIERPTVSKEHPTMKPLELVERGLSHVIADVCFDPFLGSGTTLIACERLNRKCRAIEIEPKYVAVTLERWHAATGLTPILLN